MPEHSYTSRRELDQYVFHGAVTVLVPVAAVLLQSVLPRHQHRHRGMENVLVELASRAVTMFGHGGQVCGFGEASLSGGCGTAGVELPFGAPGVSSAAGGVTPGV